MSFRRGKNNPKKKIIEVIVKFLFCFVLISKIDEDFLALYFLLIST